MEQKELPVPWYPKCKDPTDTSNFDAYPAMSSGKITQSAKTVRNFNYARTACEFSFLLFIYC